MIIEKHLIPGLGNLPLHQLQPSHLQAYYAKAQTEGRSDHKGGLSARTVKHHHRVLSEALNHAVRWGLVVRNVAQAVDPPRPVNKEMTTMNEDQVSAFLEAARQTPYYHLFYLAIYTGMRRSELLGLKWRDVDLMMGTLSVTQVMHRLQDGSYVFMEPKTAKSRRQVSLSPNAVLTLREYREKAEALAESLGTRLTGAALVFAGVDGKPLCPITVNHAFVRITKKAGLAGVRMHDLRHTHAILMLKQGINPKIVQERLGHSSISVTLDVYSHVMPGLQEAAALRFDEGLTKKTLAVPVEVG